MNRKLSDTLNLKIARLVQEQFEWGYTTDEEDVHDIISEDEDFKGVEKEAEKYFLELLSYSPAGFYKKFKDELNNWDKDFVVEYGGENER